MTHTAHSLEEILAAVYLAGISNGLHRDLTDPEEIMHRKEGFIKANPVCKDAVKAIDHYTTTKINEVLDQISTELESDLFGHDFERLQTVLSQIRKANDE